jgi:Fe-S cluster assembly iron-binding protein IscA
MGMALDEPKEEDRAIETTHLTFIMAPDVESFVSQSGGLVIDFVDDGMRKGYTVTLGNRAGDACGSCGEHGGDCG